MPRPVNRHFRQSSDYYFVIKEVDNCIYNSLLSIVELLTSCFPFFTYCSDRGCCGDVARRAGPPPPRGAAAAGVGAIH